jgi:hypothetical protein
LRLKYLPQPDKTITASTAQGLFPPPEQPLHQHNEEKEHTMIRKITMSLIALMLVFALVSPVFADDSEPTSQVVDEISDYCTTKPGIHPGIHQLTKIYKMTQDDLEIIQSWFCKEYADLGDIRQALRAAVRSDGSVTIAELEGLLEIPKEGEQVPPPVTTEDDMDDKSNSFYCRDLEGGKQHPTALRYAEMYNSVDYAKIMEWFCNGYGFGQIKHALNTAMQNDGDKPNPESYLKQRDEGKGWGVIWNATGKPAKVHPVFGPNGKKNSTQEEGDPVVTSPQGKGKPNKPGK